VSVCVRSVLDSGVRGSAESAGVLRQRRASISVFPAASRGTRARVASATSTEEALVREPDRESGMLSMCARFTWAVERMMTLYVPPPEGDSDAGTSGVPPWSPSMAPVHESRGKPCNAASGVRPLRQGQARLRATRCWPGDRAQFRRLVGRRKERAPVPP
jgi:hypothetical protein